MGRAAFDDSEAQRMGEASSTESAPAQSTSSAKPSAPPNGAGLPAAMAEVVEDMADLLIQQPSFGFALPCPPCPPLASPSSPLLSPPYFGTRYGDMEHVAAAFDAAETRACPPPCHWGRGTGTWRTWQQRSTLQKPALVPPLVIGLSPFSSAPRVMVAGYGDMENVAAAFDAAEIPPLFPPLSSPLSLVFLQFSSAPRVWGRRYWDMEDVAAAFDAAETPPLSPPLSSPLSSIFL
ncbi:unnamed protein product [Closterium sp. NIES-65]|nr:unnamed protein product [Closterium sp. NIES-65]